MGGQAQGIARALAGVLQFESTFQSLSSQIHCPVQSYVILHPLFQATELPTRLLTAAGLDSNAGSERSDLEQWKFRLGKGTRDPTPAQSGSHTRLQNSGSTASALSPEDKKIKKKCLCTWPARLPQVPSHSAFSFRLTQFSEPQVTMVLRPKPDNLHWPS